MSFNKPTMNVLLTDLDINEMGPLALTIFKGAGMWVVDDIFSTPVVEISDRLKASLHRVRENSKVDDDAYWRDVLARCENIVHKIHIAHVSPEIPGWCKCGITGKIMTDPVVTPQGVSYERSAIVESIKQQSIDPMCGSVLHIDQLTPNIQLSEAIKNVIVSQNIRFREDDLDL